MNKNANPALEQEIVFFSKVPYWNAKEYILEHPRLLSQKSFVILKDLGITESYAILKYLWMVSIESVFDLPSNNRNRHIVVDELIKRGIFQLQDLRQQILIDPEIREQVGLLALGALSDDEWAIIIALALTETNDTETMSIAEEYPFLLDYSANEKLEYIYAWSENNAGEDDRKTISSCLVALKGVRDLVAKGELSLGNAKIYRLVMQYFYLKSWSDKAEFLKKNSTALFSEVGIAEMDRLIYGTFISLFNEGDWYSIASAMYHREVLLKCWHHGFEFSFSKHGIPNLPMQLWAIAGLVLIGKKQIRNWTEYKILLQENPDVVQLHAKMLPLILSSSDDSEVETKQKLLAMISDEKIPTEYYTRLVLLQFALRCEPSDLLDLLKYEPWTTDDIMAKSVFMLADLLMELNEFDNAESIMGFLQLVTQKNNAILYTLEKIEPNRLKEIVSTGAGLAALAGAIIGLVNLDSDIERAKYINTWNLLTSNEAIELSSEIYQYIYDPSLKEHCRSTFEQMQQAANLGEFGHLIMQVLPDNQLAQAIFAWAGATNDEQSLRVAEKFPVLLSNDALSFIEHLLSYSPESVSEEEISELNQFRESIRNRYVILLKTQRANREKSFVRIMPDVPNKDRLIHLISDLELYLPARIWVPFSRIELDKYFFVVLDSWISQIQGKFGPDAAANLIRLKSIAVELKSQFGDKQEEHAIELSDHLFKIFSRYVNIDNDKKYEFLIEVEDLYPDVFQPASLAIIDDWITFGKHVEDIFIINHLGALRDWLSKAIDTNALTASFDIKHGKLPPNVAEVAQRIFKKGTIQSFADLFETFMSASQNEILSFIDATSSVFNKGNDPLAKMLIDQIKVQSVFNQFVEVIKSGDAKKLTALVIKEPVVFTEPFFEYARSKEIPEALLNILIELKPLSDPIIQKVVIGENLSDDENKELERVDFVLSGLFLLENPLLCFPFLINNPLIFTDRAWYWLKINGSSILDHLAKSLGQEKAEQRFNDAKEILVRCKKTSPQYEYQEYLKRNFITEDMLPGDVDVSFWPDYVILFAQLPSKMRNLLSEAKSTEDMLALFENLLQDNNLPTELRAIACFMAGIYARASFEQTHELELLDQAIDRFEASVRLTRENDYIRLASRCIWLGSALDARSPLSIYRHDDIEKAIYYLRKSISIPNLDSTILGRGLGFLGIALTSRYDAFGQINDLKDAIDYLQKAIQLTPEGDRDWFGWHISLGISYVRIWEKYDDYDARTKAKAVYEKALQALPNNSDLRFTLSNNLANLELDTAQSSEDFDQLDVFFRTQATDPKKSFYERASGFNGLGNTFSRKFKISGNKQDLDNAIESYSRGIQLLKPDTLDWFKFSSNLANKLFSRGTKFNNLGDISQALDLYKTLLNSTVINEWPQVVFIFAEDLGDMLALRLFISLAIEAQMKAAEAYIMMRRSSMVVQERITMSETGIKLYSKLIHLLLSVGNVNKAFEYATYAKSQTFADQLVSGRVHITPSDPKLKAMLSERERIQTQIIALRQRLVGSTNKPVYTSMAIDVVTNELAIAQKKETELWEKILQEYPEFSDLYFSDRLTANQACQLSLELDATIIDYYDNGVLSGAFVISPDGIKFVNFSHGLDWEKWIITYFEGMVLIEKSNQAFRQIYEIFWQPLKSLLPEPGSKIILSPSGPLVNLPLSVAFDGDKYICDRYIISIVPSTKILSILNNREKRSSFSNIMTVAYAGEENSSHYLKYAEMESDIICKQFPESTRLNGQSASSKMISSSITAFDILHFACHGVLDWENPDQSGLVLANGEWLTISYIMNTLDLSKKTPLVVMSACSVGSEKALIGDEYQGTARAFMYAGANTVLASLWPIEDFSTVLLMLHFYDELKKTKGINSKFSVAKALQNSQMWLKDLNITKLLEILEEMLYDFYNKNQAEYAKSIKHQIAYFRKHSEEFPFRNPYYWAGFQVTGL